MLGTSAEHPATYAALEEMPSEDAVRNHYQGLVIYILSRHSWRYPVFAEECKLEHVEHLVRIDCCSIVGHYLTLHYIWVIVILLYLEYIQLLYEILLQSPNIHMR